MKNKINIILSCLLLCLSGCFNTSSNIGMNNDGNSSSSNIESSYNSNLNNDYDNTQSNYSRNGQKIIRAQENIVTVHDALTNDNVLKKNKVRTPLRAIELNDLTGEFIEENFDSNVLVKTMSEPLSFAFAVLDNNYCYYHNSLYVCLVLFCNCYQRNARNKLKHLDFQFEMQNCFYKC